MRSEARRPEPHSTARPTLALALVVSVVHLAVLIVLMWTFRPQLGVNVRVVEGVPKPFLACYSKGCDEGIGIGEVVLACGINVLGPSYSCPQTFRQDVQARAVFFTMPTLLSSIGVGGPTRVLMRLEQGDSVLYDRDPDSLTRRYLFSSILTYVLFGVSAFIVTTTLIARRNAAAGGTRR
jgi:hypothetical protein